MEYDKITVPLWLIAGMLAQLNKWYVATWIMLLNAALIIAFRVIALFKNE